MSVQEQIKNFYESLNNSYYQLYDNKVYKIISSFQNWEDIVLVNDINENLKPSLKYISKNYENNNYEHYVQYSIEIYRLTKSPYLDKVKSSILDIVCV